MRRVWSEKRSDDVIVIHQRKDSLKAQEKDEEHWTSGRPGGKRIEEDWSMYVVILVKKKKCPPQAHVLNMWSSTGDMSGEEGGYATFRKWV